MPARGRRSAKPFTRRRSAAAFRLRPPVPRMNLSPNRGREDGAAVRPGPPGVVRLRPLLAGRQVLPGWGMAARSAPCGGRLQPVPAPSPMLFFRRPFAEGLFRRPVPSGRRRFFLCPTERSALPPPLVSAPSPLRPLSAPTPLRSAPSPSRPVPVPSPFLSRSSPRPCPCPALPCPVPAPSLSRPCPCPCPCPCPVPVPFLSRSCPLSVLFLSCPRPRPRPRSRPRPRPRSRPRPLFWRGAASSLFFGPRVEKPEKLFRFVISK